MAALKQPRRDHPRMRMAAFLVILVCSVSIVALLSQARLSYGDTRYPAVYGIVSDEGGACLSNVTLKLYTQAGALVATVYSDSDGAFILENLGYGTYSLHLNKVGYAPVVQSIVINSWWQNLSTIALPAALKLSTSILTLKAGLGDQITIPFTAENSGEDDEVVEFSISSPGDWSTKVVSGTYEVTKVSLSPGQSLALELMVTVPSTASVDLDYNVSLTGVGTTNSSLIFTVSPRTQPTALVSGNVVDEYDNGMNDITVNSYSSDGAIVKTAETSFNGSFVFTLPTGETISIHFSKAGYTEVIKTVYLNSEDEKRDLGEIVLAKAIRLTTSILGAVASPGDKLQLPFAVSNMGEDSENVEFSVSNPENWYARVLDETSREIKNASLSSGATSSFQLEVNIPLGSTGVYDLALTTVGKTTSRLDFVIQVESTTESIISCQFPGKSATPGDTVKFQLELTNPFNVQVRFRLSVSLVPPNWTVSIKTATGEYVTETILGANAAVSLVVEAESPDSAATRETYSIMFTAEANDQNVTTSLPLNVALTEAAQQITITAKLPETAVEAGSVVDYSITVSNLGTIDRLLLLSSEPPSGWKSVFKAGSVEVTRLYIYAGNTDAIVVEVTPPSTVGLDTYTIPVQIKSESGTVLAKMDLKTTILGSYDLTLEMSTLLTSAESGGSTSLTARVTNTGYTSITGVVLVITLPEETWTSTMSPVQVNELKPREYASFTVVVKIPENTVAGDYMVTVKGSSDQVSSDQLQVRVTASTSTSWGLYGVGLAIGFIVVLLLVFRRFRRR